MTRLHLLAATAALALSTPGLAANLLTNGSFETLDLTGWSLFGDTDYTGVYAGTVNEPPTDGAAQAYFGPLSLGGISQTVTGRAGTYTISFDLGNQGGTFSSVDFGGVNLLSGIGDQGFTTYSFNVTVAANPTLRFSFVNVPYYYALDNVSVSAVPEPANWAMLIAGFGLVGAAARRRRIAVTA